MPTRTRPSAAADSNAETKTAASAAANDDEGRDTMHITAKKLGTAATGAALLAALGVATTPAASTAAPTAASARSTGWHCKHSKYTDDGDPGGSSGWVKRLWKESGAYVNARFYAGDEIFILENETTTSVSGTLYVKGGNAGGYYAFSTINLKSNQSHNSRDLSIKDGTRVYIRVSIHNRGTCTSPKFTA